MNSRIRLVVFLILALVVGVALVDSLGAFDDKPYFEVPHGSHTHYVAKDRDPNVSVSQFPTRPPGPGERITPTGQIVRE
jgi:hypothetical protein